MLFATPYIYPEDNLPSAISLRDRNRQREPLGVWQFNGDDDGLTVEEAVDAALDKIGLRGEDVNIQPSESLSYDAFDLVTANAPYLETDK